MTTTLGRPAAARLAANEYRVEGRDKVRGAMAYTADVKRPNMLWAAYTTSPHAHARIVAIDTTAAKAVPGVRAVLTADDVGHRRFGRQLCDWPVLAWDRVLLIGDRVAAVAAETRQAAEDAARLVEVTYEELEPVLDPLQALAPGTPILHPDRATYLHPAFAGKPPMELPHLNVQGWTRMEKGERDLERFFTDPAYRVFENYYETPRLHAGYVEPRSTLVWLDDDGTVHVVTPNKQPFLVRDWLARCIEVPKERVIVEPSAIGGDFGGKGWTIDEFTCYFLAKATGRPVRYVNTYTEELGTAPARHRTHLTLKSAVDAGGTIVAHTCEVIYDGGAYGGGVPSPRVLPGNGFSTVPYAIPNLRVDITSVYTNQLVGGHVRSPNDVQVFFAYEQHVDAIATALALDPIELRRRNVVQGTQTAVTGEAMAHPMGIAVLDTLQRELAAAPVAPGRGRGISLVCRHTGGGKTATKLRLHADGTIEAVIGAPEQGAGMLTMAQRVAATVLDVSFERVRVRRGNTAEAAFDPGAGGSRVTHVVGRATQAAAEQLKTMLEERSGLTLRADAFVDAAGRSEPFDAVAARVCSAGPLDTLGSYDATHTDPNHAGDFTFTAFAIDVEVDRETGQVAVRDALVVTDVGAILNPLAHQGQIDGGFIYGYGNALMEEIAVDESGKVATLSLGEYKLPTIADIPPLRTVLVAGPGGEGPFGAKMAGELSNTGVVPAIANAIHAATGARLATFPLTAERIYAALQRSA